MSAAIGNYSQSEVDRPPNSNLLGVTLFFLAIATWITIVAIAVVMWNDFASSERHPFDQTTEEYAPAQPITDVSSPALQEVKSGHSRAIVCEQKLVAAPEDGARMHLSLLFPTYPDPLYEQVKGWSISGRLAEIRSRTHWHEYRADNALYLERLSNVVTQDQLPALVMQNAAGQVLYVASGPQIPATDEELVSELRQAAGQYKASLIANQQPRPSPIGQSTGSPYCPPGRRCPQPQPRFPNTPYPNQPQPYDPGPQIDPALQPNRLPWVRPVFPDRPLVAPLVRPIHDGLQGLKQLIYVLLGFIVVVLLLAVIGLAYFSKIQRPW
jgi:hypothetical protein